MTRLTYLPFALGKAFSSRFCSGVLWPVLLDSVQISVMQALVCKLRIGALFTLPATELLTLTRAKFYLRFRIEVRILIWGGFVFSDTLAMFIGILLVMTGELLL